MCISDTSDYKYSLITWFCIIRVSETFPIIRVPSPSYLSFAFNHVELVIFIESPPNAYSEPECFSRNPFPRTASEKQHLLIRPTDYDLTGERDAELITRLGHAGKHECSSSSFSKTRENRFPLCYEQNGADRLRSFAKVRYIMYTGENRAN